MKRTISALLAAAMTAAALSAMPVDAVTAPLLSTNFENGLDGWTGRSAQVAVSDAAAASGSQSAHVTGRTASWNGISYAMSGPQFTAGTECVFTAKAMQNTTVSAVTFKMTVQYNGANGAVYDTFATETVMAGAWATLSGTYTLPDPSTNPILYFETEASTCDFYLDDVLVRLKDDIGVPDPVFAEKGDVNNDGVIDKTDVKLLQAYLLGQAREVDMNGADLNKDSKINAIDLTLLKRLILFPPAVTTTAITEGSQQTTTVSTQNINYGSTDPEEYMAKIAAQMTQNVPNNVKASDAGQQTRFSYQSKKAGRMKNAICWTPPGYDPSKSYNVMYMNHGIFGNETSMLGGFSVTEMASALISSGEAEPFIIIFTQMYTGTDTDVPSFMNMNMQTMDGYDDFVFDMTESLMPYVEEHWNVKKGREHTAIAGFSMGGRESLYLTLMRPDIFGYCCASSPAPGIVPCVDQYLTHLGSYNLARTARLTDNDFKLSKDQLPYLLMIGGGTNDGVVGNFPQQYHELFDKNGTKNIWMSVAGGGHDGSVGTPLFYNYFRAVFKA